jgi:ankyrin repeat protein
MCWRTGDPDSATEILLGFLIKNGPKHGRPVSHKILEALRRVLWCVCYMLNCLAGDLITEPDNCIGDCWRLLHNIEDVNFQNQDGSTALHISAEFGFLDSMQSLLMLKANVSLMDRDGETPAQKAERNGHNSCFRLLTCMETIQNLSCSGDESVMQNQIDLMIVDPIMATLNDLDDVRVGMRVVLARGYQHVRNASGGPLKWKDEGIISTIDLLSKDAVGVKKIGFQNNSVWSYGLEALSLAEPLDCGWSLLMLAAEVGKVEQVMFLLKANADINACTKRRQTCLHVAAHAGNRAIVEILLEGKANVNAKDDFGRMALHHAAEQGFTNILPLLLNLEPHALLGVRDKKQCTPLHYAATTCGEAVRLLVRLKADIEAKGPHERTPLHLAAASGRIDCLSALLELKANHEARDEKGNTPLNLCRGEGGIYVLKMSGANGWTPLMVASDRDGDEISNYAVVSSGVASCFKALQQRGSFPTWFEEDIKFYTQLSVNRHKWRWGILEATLTVTQSEDGIHIKKTKPDSPDFSCMLGSEVLAEGIHEWELIVDNVQSMWVGIARGISEHKLLASNPTRPGDDGYLLAFHSLDCSNPTVYGSKKPKSRSLPVARYGSGDKLTLQLDTKRHILRLKINGTVVVVVSNVDDIGVRPYACLDCTESICLLNQTSCVFNACNTGDDEECGLNNEIWPAESEALLKKYQGLDFLQLIMP